MTHPDLERELHDHYRSLEVGPGGRASARVAQALDRAPARRWSLARLATPRVALSAGAAVAAVALLTVALLPLWNGSVAGPGTSPTVSPTASPTDSAGTIAAAHITQAGLTRDGVLWATRDNALSISTDGGRTWHENPLPQAATSDSIDSIGYVAVADADHAWLLVKHERPVGSTFAVFRTSDGGATWQRADLPGTFDGVPWQMAFVDAKVGFVILTASTDVPVGPSTVMRTLDGGVTWTVTSTTATLRMPVVAVDANTLWIVANPDEVASLSPLLQVSRDAGATWSSPSLPGLEGATVSGSLYVLSGPTGGIEFLSATEGYVAVFQKTSTALATRYYRTVDGGRNWSLVASTAAQDSIAPVFVDATHWYRQLDPSLNGLEVTADGGQTWTTVAGNGLPNETGILFLWTVDGQNLAAVCAVNPSSGDGVVALLLSRDGGKNWQPADFSAR
jgi:photosystem II stability/assembly factor-like uncharacterized protein